ncbi:MAG: hypothetical protein JOY54_08895 [Acidobacteriaceae bacterium]|nr:hypothetical protein [Acidobacteriaceae bacterium]
MDPTSKSLDTQLAETIRERDELQRALDSCRAELAQARHESEQSAAAAQAANEELQQFVYAASHDLQQPLRTISTYTQLLQRELGKDKPPAEFTSFIIDAAHQMSQLVRDLLTYSRTAVSIRRTNVHLNVPLQSALFKLAQPIRETNATIVVHELPEVQADEAQLAQLFDYIICNSLLYRGTEPPTIEVSAEEGPDAFTIAVQDNGTGIEPRFHEQVFIPFKRLVGKSIPGSGLGLSLCRKIVRAHGGNIWVESDGQNGAVVKFTIPL